MELHFSKCFNRNKTLDGQKCTEKHIIQIQYIIIMIKSIMCKSSFFFVAQLFESLSAPNYEVKTAKHRGAPVVKRYFLLILQRSAKSWRSRCKMYYLNFCGGFQKNSYSTHRIQSQSQNLTWQKYNAEPPIYMHYVREIES